MNNRYILYFVIVFVIVFIVTYIFGTFFVSKVNISFVGWFVIGVAIVILSEIYKQYKNSGTPKEGKQK